MSWSLFAGVAVGYLVASFVVAFYLAAAVWGTQGTPLVVIIVPLFPLMPFWFAISQWWAPVAAFVGLLVATSPVFWSIFADQYQSERVTRSALTALVFIGVQCIAAPILIHLFNARHGTDADYGKTMAGAVVVQFVLSALYSRWFKRRDQI